MYDLLFMPVGFTPIDIRTNIMFHVYNQRYLHNTHPRNRQQSQYTTVQVEGSPC